MSSKTYMALCAALPTLVRVLSKKVFSTWTLVDQWASQAFFVSCWGVKPED